MLGPKIDLTPFGYTPTESLVYAALLSVGRASGYGVGKELNLARANVYQALHGLVGKGAATCSSDSPQLFEAVTPNTLLAHLTRSQSDRLDRLERQLRGADRHGERGLVSIESRRSMLDLVLRTAARSPGVLALADADTLVAMTPVWHKRAADGADTRVWVAGPELPSLPVPVSGAIEPQRVEAAFGTIPVAIIVAAEAAAIASRTGREWAGHWTSYPLLVAAIRGTVDYLTMKQ